MNTVYKIKSDAGAMFVSANLVEASAPIWTYFGNDPLYDANGDESDEDGNRWAPTPYQTADCAHDADRLAKLVAEYCDLGDVSSIEAIN